MVGIIGYGVYIPLYRIKTEEIANVWGRDVEVVKNGLLINEKSVPYIDEDTVTMSIESSINAINRAGIDPQEIGAIYSGSETPAYAVKPNISMISNAIGMSRNHSGADVEFACKAGTAALQLTMGLVKSNIIKYGLAIGADTGEYYAENIGDQSSSAGSAAFILGNNPKEMVAEIKETLSYTSDVPDFWRRPQTRYPTHAEKFTAEPAYFKHTITATKLLMEKAEIKLSDVDHVVFHTPNGKFPLKVAKLLGFTKEQIKTGFVVDKIGNTYSAASLIGLASVLDVAEPNQNIIVTSFGSGAGSDAFYIRVTDEIEEKRNKSKTTKYYLDRKKYVDYATYCKFTNKIE